MEEGGLRDGHGSVQGSSNFSRFRFDLNFEKPEPCPSLGGLGEISPSLSVLLFRLIFQNLRKSLTICTKFSYFYLFKLCGIAAFRSEDKKLVSAAPLGLKCGTHIFI